MTHAATNKALLQVLGIDQPLITALQIHMQPDKLPVVTMDCLIDSKAMLHQVSHFDLVLREDTPPATEPAPAPALDLDAMCTAAFQRVADTAAQASTRALDKQLAESKQIRQRLRDACGRYSAEAGQAIGWIERGPLIKDLLRSLNAKSIFPMLGGWPTLGGVSSPGLFTGLTDRFESIGSALGGARK